MTLWSIAGHDPYSAAGQSADLLCAEALGLRTRVILSSLTAQNDQQVLRSEAVSMEWFQAQWQALVAVEKPKVLKLGLIQSSAQLAFLAEQCRKLGEHTQVIVDPVLTASSGDRLAPEELLTAFREYLLPHITLLTPNLPECEEWLGRRLPQASDTEAAAQALLKEGLAAVLIKGGHREGEEKWDYFCDQLGGFWLQGKAVPYSYRGTGCRLATAIACFLWQGRTLRESVILAHSFLQQTIHENFQQQSQALRLRPGTFPLSTLRLEPVPQKQAFPSLDRPLGFYPVLPSADWIERLAPFGLQTVQLRIKDLEPKLWLDEAKRAQAICTAHQIKLFINDKIDIAQAVGAYGVHLGQEDLLALSPQQKQNLLDSGLRLGISTHSIEEAAYALSYQPSYWALGPIFATSCKSMNFGPQGFSRLTEWKSYAPKLPLVAIGGLKLTDVPPALQAGADAIAVISAITEAEEPEIHLAAWLQALKQST